MSVKISGNIVIRGFTSIKSLIAEASGPITQVQKKTYASTGATALTHTIILDTTPVQNNLLVMCVDSDGLLDTPSGWSLAASEVEFSIGAIFYKIAGASEPTSVSVTQDSDNSMCITILEYSGIATTTPLDQTNTNDADNSPLGSGAITTTQADELIVAVAAFHYAIDSTITSWSNSFTEESSELATAGALLRLGVATRIVSSTGTYSTEATAVNAANAVHVGVIASFKKAASAPTPTPTPTSTPTPTPTGATFALYTSSASSSYIPNQGVNAHQMYNVFTSLPSNSLVIASFGTSNDSSEVVDDFPSMSSTPALTWNLGLSQNTSLLGNTSVYYANFVNGGNLSVTGSWGKADGTHYSLASHVFTGAMTGSISSSINQDAPLVNITTTKNNSYVLVITNDWFPADGSSRTYRNTPITESAYHYYAGKSAAYHYYKVTTSSGSYTLGLTAPTGQYDTTIAFEIKSIN